jgi:hypothetical protein
MLTPAQIIPFLGHDDPDVRRHARRYLVAAHDAAPATAEDFWAAADKVPPEEVGPFLDQLGFVRQTEPSLRRLLDELPKADPASRDSLTRTLERVEFELLKSQWDTIRGSEAVDDRLRAHLQARLDLTSEPVEPLWNRMMGFATSLGERDLNEQEELEADRLIEAVARHPDAFRDRVLAALGDPNVKGWAELFVTDVAGEMRLGDAVGPLLDKLAAPDNELLWEVAAGALVHVGDERVVTPLAQRFPGADPGFQISAAEVLGRIKRPESLAALTRLVTEERDLGTVSYLLSAIVDLVPDEPDTIATLRGIAREGGYDRSVLRLEEDLLILATMTGVDLPEGPEWREKLAQTRARLAMGMSNVDSLFQGGAPFVPSTLVTAPMRPVRRDGRYTGGGTAAVAERPQAPAARRQPFRNAQAKVGRNDPCPCGSGKKFKKCCGK